MAPAAAQHPRTLGIDVGGTKTHLAVGTKPHPAVGTKPHLAVGVDGAPQRERIVDTTTWRTHSYPHNAAALHGLVRDWLGDEALGWPLAVGAHGCDTTAQCESFAAELARFFTGGVRVVNDAELLTPALGLGEGIGVIVGTGSIAVARDAAGRLVTSGGWGWVLGDEGSAAGLLREATRAVLRALDLRPLDLAAPPDPLTRRLFAAFGVDEAPELALAVSTASSAAWLGSKVVEVFEAADEGSALAAEVIRAGGEALATLVDRLLARGVPGARIVAAGTVIRAQPRLRTVFVDAVRDRHPEGSVHFLDRPPVFGALALASDLSLTPAPPNTSTLGVTP
jgi:N-acetylglucosamine kinase-like BadF-type ATPase